MSMASVVEVEHLSKTFRIPHEKRATVFETLAGALRKNEYEVFNVLEDVSFSVAEGECVGVIGENGSGKSTLLKVIANILRPTKGKVAVLGRMTPFLELGVGFQPDLTVRENVGMYATIMGLSNGMIRDRIEEVIDFAGLARFEDAKLKNLSSGMQVRLAFSTAIQTDPDVLLVDEVLAVGDMEFQQKCFEVFKRYRKEGVTILFVSHDLGAVRRFCDKTLLLSHGRQVAFGDTGEIIDRYVYGGEGREKAEEGSKAGVDGGEVDAVQPEAQTENSPENEGTKLRRWGDGKVVITDVELLDKFGVRGERFSSFDPMTVRIHYDAKERINDPIFGIALYDEEERHLYGTNTELKDHPIESVQGPGHVDLLVSRIPMLAGKFLLTVAAHTRNGKPYDWLDKQYSFEVVSAGRDAGIIEVPCRWVR
jgi:lipopolysaccharide transport system ATP-binding protein